MTASPTIDSDTAALLAGLDPALASLEAALWSVQDGRNLVLHDVCWAPGDSCHLAFRKDSPAEPAFVGVTVDVDGWSERDYRDDPALPGIRRATDPVVVAEMLSAVLRSPVADVRIEPVRYRVGSRCVLRYDVPTELGSRTVYAKVVAPEAFDRLARGSAALAQDPAWTRLGANFLGSWPELGVVLSTGVTGVAASRVLGDASVPLTRRTRTAHALGTALAELHTLNGVDVPLWTPDDQVETVRAAARAVVTVHPALGARLLEILDRLAARPPGQREPNVCHGGFRAGQVVVSGDGHLTLLDLDGCCLGDRARDLGTALAHLFWQAVRQPQQRASLEPLETALVAGYRERAPDFSLETLDWWRSMAVLQLAARRYRRLEASDWALVPALVDAAARLADSWESRSRPGTGADLLDLPTMSRLLGPLLGRHEPSAGPTAIRSAAQLAAAEGRRMVVSYTVGGDGDRATSSLVAKTFTELSRAQLLDQHLRLLHDGPFHADDLRVPEPLGLLPEHRLVLLRGFAGTPLSAITDPAAAAGGSRQAGQWLARLHASGVPLPRRLSLQHEADVTLEWSARIGELHPDLADRARQLALGWPRSLQECPVDHQVPLHKDFHAGHVLVSKAVCVVDLDEARLGDRAMDVAHFVTYLEAVPAGSRWEALRDAFLESYAERSGWQGSDSFDAFCAYTWLKIAKQRASGSGPFPAMPRDARGPLVETAIAEGERCLGG